MVTMKRLSWFRFTATDSYHKAMKVTRLSYPSSHRQIILCRCTTIISTSATPAPNKSTSGNPRLVSFRTQNCFALCIGDSGKVPIQVASQTHAPPDVIATLLDRDTATLHMADQAGSMPQHECCFRCDTTREWFGLFCPVGSFLVFGSWHVACHDSGLVRQY